MVRGYNSKAQLEYRAVLASIKNMHHSQQTSRPGTLN